MKSNYRNFAIVLAVGAISLLQACQKDDQFNPQLDQFALSNTERKVNTVNTFYSSTVPIGNGVGRAWVSENNEGEPVGVGVNLSEKALMNLPAVPTGYVLILPKNKGKNFYTHVLLDWNPEGHEPEFAYGAPHFDVHFYIIPNKDRLAIGPNDNVQFDNLPDPVYIPLAYGNGPGVPQMGVHWVDFLAPEFNGGTFTKTFIWGSYDGKFIFWEPMITRDYLLTHPNSITDIRQPDAYQSDGYYATQYKVSYSVSPKEYSISLVNLVYHGGE